ncbi:MAG: hypothetical protein M3Q57_00280 [Pseudomonadota bacterium]|nr:hypothetical protein [Pseudomonadota bacterium]
MEHDAVHDKASFAQYVAQLIVELDDPVLSRKWLNADLRSFFEEMEAWASDSIEPANPNPWRHAADVIGAARIYE